LDGVEEVVAAEGEVIYFFHSLANIATALLRSKNMKCEQPLLNEAATHSMPYATSYSIV
jgi:hypothetical protein